MLSTEQVQRIEKIYNYYRANIKPLIAAIEARYEKFPIQVFNEVRALFDHIAHCYNPDNESVFIDKEITRAESHLYRIIFDCFKFLNVHYKDNLVKFEKQTKNIDLTCISDGEFYLEYKRLSNMAYQSAKEAKESEGLDKVASLESFDKAYNAYAKLESHIDNNRIFINRAKWKFRGVRLFKFFLWFIAAVMSGFISLMFTCPQVVDSFKTFIKSLF